MWQTIDSAPKDGTNILLADNEGYVCEGQFERDEGWYEANSHSTDYIERKIYPTHWMPLPLPPNAP